MPENVPGSGQVRSVTAVLKANFGQYDAATARSAAATKKATGEMAAAAKSAATQVDAAARKMSTAQERAAKSIEKSAQAAQRAATQEQAAARKSAAAAEREAKRKATAADRAAAQQEQAIRRMAAAEAAAYREQAARTKAAEQAMSRAADARHQAMSDLGTTVGMTSAAVLAAATVAVKGFADFEAQMSRVSAAMDADAASMDRLKTAALEAGQATKYSATEAAAAEEELGKAGLSVQEIVGGGLTASMALAAAGGMELADAAEVAATTMTTFGLSAAEVPAVADALAAGAGKASGNVSDLAYGLKMSGLVANQLGISMTDTVGTLAAFAQNSLKGSDAGTSFKTMLSFLQPKSDDARDAMKDLGLEFYDAHGRFVGITEVAGQLQTKLGGLTQEQRMATMYTIFGSDAIRAANVLYKEGAAGIQEWIDAVNDQGYAARVAAKAQDNLKGDIEKLGGAIETALIQSGGGGASGLRKLTQEATKAVDAFSSLPSPVANTATVIGLVAGAAGLGVAAFLKIVPAIAETKAAMMALNITAATTRTRLASVASFVGGPWGAAFALGSIALDTWIERQHEAAEKSRSLREALDQQTGAMTAMSRKIIADDLAAERHENPVLPDWLIRGGDTRSMAQRAKDLGFSLREVQLAAEGDAAALGTVKRAMEAAFAAKDQDRLKQLGDLYDYLTAQTGDLAKQRRSIQLSAEATRDLGGVAGEAAGNVDEFGNALEDAEKATEEEAEALQALKDSLNAANNLFLTGREAARGYEAALDAASAAAKKNGKTLDDGTEKGRANAEALDAVAKAGLAQLQVLVDQQVPQRKFTMAMAETRSDLIRVAQKFGMSKRAATAYADEIFKIPAKKATEIYLKNAEKAKRQAEELYNRVRSMPNKKTITLTIREVFENYGGESAARERYGAAGLLKRAEGGPIPARLGTPGRDSVPILAMPEEYVVRAREARRHLPLLEAINSGRLPAFAGGGQVGARASASMSMTGPRVVMVPVQETHTTAATVHVGTVVAQDAKSFVGWGARRSFDATTGIT